VVFPGVFRFAISLLPLSSTVRLKAPLQFRYFPKFENKNQTLPSIFCLAAVELLFPIYAHFIWRGPSHTYGYSLGTLELYTFQSVECQGEISLGRNCPRLRFEGVSVAKMSQFLDDRGDLLSSVDGV
jgi:hypothetical protein